VSTKVEKRILVNVPVSVAYNQWTQFEEFPLFMGGVKSVKQLSDNKLEWTAEIGGVRRQWQARILEQVPDQKVAWAATEGATNAGSVTFEDLGGGQTSVQLSLEYEPEGVVEKIGDKLNVVEKQAASDLDRFKAFTEDEGYATGAWRGTVGEGQQTGTPGVEDAAASRGQRESRRVRQGDCLRRRPRYSRPHPRPCRPRALREASSRARDSATVTAWSRTRRAPLATLGAAPTPNLSIRQTAWSTPKEIQTGRP
jgi:uncharacterized membrane protein